MIMDSDFKQEPPTEEDIQGYAEWLGIDEHPELFWIAKEGLMASLPNNWKPCKTEDDNVYYFNYETGESQWDHPMDEFYKDLAAEELKKLKDAQPNAEHTDSSTDSSPPSEQVSTTNSSFENQAKDPDTLKLDPSQLLSASPANDSPSPKSPLYISPVKSMSKRRLISSDDEAAEEREEENPFEEKSPTHTSTHNNKPLESSSDSINNSTTDEDGDRKPTFTARKYPPNFIETNSQLQHRRNSDGSIQVEDMTVQSFSTSQLEDNDQQESAKENTTPNISINIEDLDQDLPINEEDKIHSPLRHQQESTSQSWQEEIDERKHILEERERSMLKKEPLSQSSANTLAQDTSQNQSIKEEKKGISSLDTKDLEKEELGMEIMSSAGSTHDATDEEHIEETIDTPTPALEQTVSPKNVSSEHALKKTQKKKKRTLNPLRLSGDVGGSNTLRAVSPSAGSSSAPHLGHTSSSFEGDTLTQKPRLTHSIPLSTSIGSVRRAGSSSPFSTDSSTVTSSRTMVPDSPSPALFTHTEAVIESQKLQQKENLLKRSVHHLRKKEKKLISSVDTLKLNEQKLKQEHSSRSKRYKKQRAELSESVTLLRRQRQELQQILEELHRQEVDRRQSLDQLRSEHNSLQNQLTEYKSQLQQQHNFKSETGELKQSVTQLRSDKKSIQDALSELKNTRAQLQSEIEQLKNNKHELNQSIDHLRETLASSKATKDLEEQQEVTRSIQNLIYHKEELTASINVIIQKQSELNQETLSMKDDKRKLNEEMTQLRQSRLQLESEVSQLKNEEETLKDSIKELSRERKDIPLQLEHLKRDFERLSKKLPEMKADYENTKDDLNFLNTEHDSIMERLKQLKSKKLILEQQIEDLLTKRKDLTKKVNQLNSEHEIGSQHSVEKHSERMQLTDSIDSLQQQKLTLQSTVSQLQEALQQMENQTNIMQITHQRLQASNQELTNYYDETKYRLKKTMEELQHLDKKKGKIQSELGHLIDHADSKEKKLKQLSDKKKQLLEEISSLKKRKSEFTKVASSPAASPKNIPSPNYRSSPKAGSFLSPSFADIDVSEIKTHTRREAWTELGDNIKLQLKTPKPRTTTSGHAPSGESQKDKITEIVNPKATSGEKQNNVSSSAAEEMKKLDQAQEFCRQEKRLIREKKKSLEDARNEWKTDKNSGTVSVEVLYKVKELLEAQAQHMNQDIEQLNHIQHYIILRKKQLQLMIESSHSAESEDSQEEMWNLPHRHGGGGISPSGGASPSVKEKLSKIEKDIDRIFRALQHHDKENQHAQRSPVASDAAADLSRSFSQPRGGRDAAVHNAYVSKWDQYFKKTLSSDSINGRLWAFQDIIKRWQDRRGQERQLMNSHENWLRQFRHQLDLGP